MFPLEILGCLLFFDCLNFGCLKKSQIVSKIYNRSRLSHEVEEEDHKDEGHNETTGLDFKTLAIAFQIFGK